MAVVVTAASGFDLGYVWKNQAGPGGAGAVGGRLLHQRCSGGRAAGPVVGPWRQGAGVQRRPGGGAAAVRDGLPAARSADRARSWAGRAGNYAKFADHLARLQAAEPHATTERLLELEREAAQATRQAPVYTDMTVSLSKSISVFHASIRENERRARLAGDEAAAARWAEVERRYQEVVQAANRAGLEYVQEWAGMTRTGYHGARVDGQETGRFEEALITVIVVAAGHQPRRGPAGPRSQPDRPAGEDRPGRQAPGAGHRVPAPGAGRGAGDRRDARGVRADARVRRAVGRAHGRQGERDRGHHAGADGRLLLAHGGDHRARCPRRSSRGRPSTAGRRTSGSCCTSGRKSRWRRVTARTRARSTGTR